MQAEAPPPPPPLPNPNNQDPKPSPDSSPEIMKIPNPRIQRYLVAVEYIGTGFSGWQKQPKSSSNCRTVAGALEDAFHKFVGKRVSITSSSRTDAGVHALSNVCHVDVERISKRKPDEVLPPHEPGVVRRAVNHFLEKNEGDIMVTDVRTIPTDFHARYNAQERTYIYRLLSGPEPLSIFEKNGAWHVPEKLDLSAMQKACNVLIGCHDFSSFRASGCQATSPVRTLDELNVCLEKDNLKCSTNAEEFGQHRGHSCFVITARARSFLYHQVRLLVGVLKAVGVGDITITDVERILNAKTVTAASAMAPARGLYLAKVKYQLP